MTKINNCYLQLPGNYLFAEIARKTTAFRELHPDRQVIRLGIGDVTRPLSPAITGALHAAVDDLASEDNFLGYGPEQGYSWLREKIADDYRRRCQVNIDAREVFISDGSKCDTGNISEIFAADSKVAVCDPVYPVYVDSNVMAGRAGTFNPQTGRWSGLIYLPCTEENGFCPQVPDAADQVPDLIYLCFPNNPTGETASREQLAAWVEYARANGSVILYDAAYAAFITEDVPRSIFEIEGARECAIEFCSFSKLAGFTGLRLAYTVIPQELEVDGIKIAKLWNRRQTTKFNGASCLSQRAGAAVFSEQGQKETACLIAYYLENAGLIRASLLAGGLKVYGGINSPYVWLKVPGNMTSWQFFDLLLQRAGVVGTPGSGFGPCGEGFFRLTGFGSREQTQEALERLGNLFDSKQEIII